MLKQTPELIHDLARHAAGTATAYQLVTGRCLLAMERGEWYKQYGCSSAIHYAMAKLGVSKRNACCMRFVAVRLEELPKLTAAAEGGKIDWSKLRLIVGKATPETEEFWLELSRRHNCHQLAELAKRTPPGGIPGDFVEEGDGPEATSLNLTLRPELHRTVEKGLVSLSLQAGRAVTMLEALELLMVGQLQARPVDEADLERAREEALLDLESKQLAFHSEVLAARDLAAEMGVAGLCQAEGAEPPTCAEGQPEGAETEATGQHTCAEEQSEVAETEETGRHTCAEAQPEAAETEETGQHTCAGGEGPSCVDEQAETAAAEDTQGVKLWDAAVAAEEVRLAGAPFSLVKRSRRPLRFNATARRPTPAQQLELRRRDLFKCSTPHCPHHIWLDTHHVAFYSEGGPTLPHNLVTLCSRCHDNVHAGLLKISGTAPDKLEFTDQDGRPLDYVVGCEVAMWIDFWLGWRGEEHECHYYQFVNGKVDMVPTRC